MAIPTISLKTQNYNPGVFNSTAYQYQQQDLSSLERSFEQREARMNQAVNQRTAVNNILGQIESQLHQDENTKQWFYNYKQNINDQIRSHIEAGNYGQAFRTATSLAGDVANDSAIQGRIKANADYNKYVEGLDKRVRSKEISETTRKRALKENEYYYDDITDDFGNVIGGTTFVGKEPVNDINWAEHTAKAAATIRPDVIQNQNLTGGVKGTEEGTTTTTGYGHSLEQVTFNEIYNQAERLLSAESDGFNKLVQSYDNDVFTRNELKEELEGLDPNSKEYQIKKQQYDFLNGLLTDNGVDITDFNAYYARKVWSYAQSMAYKKESFDNKNITDWPSGRAPGSGDIVPKHELDNLWPTVPGPQVRFASELNSGFVSMSGQNIVSRVKQFKNKQNGTKG